MLNPTRDILTNKYTCGICHYSCIKNSDFIKHLNTNKHNAHKCSFNAHKTDIFTCECGKTYKHIQSYNRHKKICGDDAHNILEDTPTNVTPIKSAPLLVDDHMQTSLILELVKQNQEFKQLLIEQNKTIIEVAKNSQINNNTISNSHNNNNNKTFNLQFFLNETCKDAMNMKDFIKSLELSLPELEKMGEIGFAEGMSRVFVNRLNSLDITKRPIHCSDIKREIIHIKDDNKWERDNANLDRLRKIIKQLTHKNILKVDDWKKANPGCTEYNSRKNDQYLRINMEAIGPVDEDDVKRDFGKIIRRVAENTAIDKKYLCV
jgi:hypothetical protein